MNMPPRVLTILKQFYQQLGWRVITLIVAAVIAGVSIGTFAALRSKDTVDHAATTKTTARATNPSTHDAAGSTKSSGSTAQNNAPKDKPGTSATKPGGSPSAGGPGGAGTGSVSGGTTGNPLAGLALIPWEGGPTYWSRFANASNWTNPSFFPIMIDNSFSQESEVQFDKAHGITAYSGGYPNYVDYSWLQNNGMYWLDASPNGTFPAASASTPNWPGMFIADEPDGSHGSAQADYDYVNNLVNSHPEGPGRFQEINFTQIVAGNYDPLYTQMMNLVNGPVSADMYWYTTLGCGPGNPGYDNLVYPPSDPAHCRTSSSYGKLIKSLRSHDTAPLQPIWAYVEDLNGGPGGQAFTANITPGQLEGAVIDSIINEARGIIYFNTSLTGPCQESVVLRNVQSNPSDCAASDAAAMSEVDGRIQQLAPVINTQSYQYSFGTNLDTMLKWYNGSAYIFAMISGDSSSTAGSRQFTLPAGLANVSSVEVLNESRTVPVSSGNFTDNFAQEYAYHIYKVTP